MLRLAVLVQLAIWVATTSAFFPWVPEQRCEQEGGCQHTKKRQLQHDLGTREAGRLIAKYDRLHDRSRRVSRRKNNYAIVPAAVPSLPHSVGIAQDGTDFSYFIQVRFGSKEKPLYMLVDTGAGSTWVMGSDCASSSCGLHDSFGPADSDTLQPATKDFSIGYGSGTVSGRVRVDSISVAGLKMQYQFGLANQTSDQFTYFPFDGILGLSMNNGANQNFLSAIKDSKQLPANIFGVSISRSSDGPNTGEISFGAVNPAKYTGEIRYTAVDPVGNGDWVIMFDGISYDGKLGPGSKGRHAYVDTGTSYIFGPQSDVKEFHKLIPGSKQLEDNVTYTVPCDSKDITVAFSGISYTISQKDWVSGPSASGVCTSNIFGHEVIPGGWLLGALLFKNVYAVFDMDKLQVGKYTLTYTQCTITNNTRVRKSGCSPETHITCHNDTAYSHSISSWRAHSSGTERPRDDGDSQHSGSPNGRTDPRAHAHIGIFRRALGGI